MSSLVLTIKSTIGLIKENLFFFFIFWAILLFLDLSNYFLHLQAGPSEENARTVEIIYQVILIYFSVCFFHGLNRWVLSRSQDLGQDFIPSSLQNSPNKVNVLQLLGESFLLTPGFILQSLFFAFSLVLGSALLVLPGLYVLFVFYFAPVVAVLYPDYQGKIFMLARELALVDIKLTVATVLFTGLIPLIPEGMIWALTGSLRSKATPFIAPFDGLLFLFCEALVFVYVFKLVSQHRKETSPQPNLGE